MNNKTIIDLKNINKYYNFKKKDEVYALKDLSLTICKGEYVAIQGKSGAGKSTLLHILELIESYNSGTFIFDEKDVKELKDKDLCQIRNKQIGIVLQSYGLVKNYTVEENTMFPLYFGKKIKKNERKILVQKALEKVGIENLVNCKANKISGGQQQRVAIARALVNEPDILYLDEPTGALDKETSKDLMEMLKMLNQKGITIIMVTHDENIAIQAKRLIKMEDGKIVSDEILNS